MKYLLYKDRIIRLFYFMMGLILRPFILVKPNRIICWSYNYNKYACNPMAFTKYLLKNHSDEFEIFWVFNPNVDTSLVDSAVSKLQKNSFKYLIALYSSKYVLNNMRNDYMDTYFMKKKGQCYIMTWHASMSLKRVERDVETLLGSKYVSRAKYDSKMCDLMLSGCKFHSDLFRKSFWYDGEILEKGTPRCDVLFTDPSFYKSIILQQYNIPKDAKIILYAPTFRQDFSIGAYMLEWRSLIDHLNQKTGEKHIVLLRMHPNFLSRNIAFLKQYLVDDILDVTLYPEMQELLCAADYLVTDYSSSMFDFSILKKPCFLYAKDIESYDRGFYISISELPYPIAKNAGELEYAFMTYDEDSYKKKLDDFYNFRIVNYETGFASEALYKWIKSKK